MKKISIVLMKIIFLIIAGVCIFGITYNIKATDIKKESINGGDYHAWIVSESRNGMKWNDGDIVKKGQKEILVLYLSKDEKGEDIVKKYYPSSLIYESSDRSIVEFDEKGYAEFKKAGEVTITIKTRYCDLGRYETSVTINVYDGTQEKTESGGLKDIVFKIIERIVYVIKNIFRF